MQKYIKNETGFTLILVLLIITLFFIFAMTLMANLLNSSSQNNKTEEDIQVENLIRMGSTYVDKLIIDTDKKVKKAENFEIGATNAETAENYRNTFMGELQISSSEIINVENNKFTYEITRYGDIQNNKFTITYTITPFINNAYYPSQTIDQEITINIE